MTQGGLSWASHTRQYTRCILTAGVPARRTTAASPGPAQAVGQREKLLPVVRCHGRGTVARRSKRPQGDSELRRGTPGHAKVKRRREIRGSFVPYGEGAELPAPLDQAQHRGVVEDQRRHACGRGRGDEQTRHAKAQEPIGRPRGHVRGRERALRGRHMIEEAPHSS